MAAPASNNTRKSNLYVGAYLSAPSVLPFALATCLPLPLCLASWPAGESLDGRSACSKHLVPACVLFGVVHDKATYLGTELLGYVREVPACHTVGRRLQDCDPRWCTHSAIDTIFAQVVRHRQTSAACAVCSAYRGCMVGRKAGGMQNTNW